MESKRLQLLQGMPIFGALKESTLDYLCEQSVVVAVAAGESFFREGDAAQSLFVLEEGTAIVEKASQDGQRILHRFGPGDCFGEMALVDMNPRSASVVAETSCLALEVHNMSLFGLYERDLEQFTMIQMNLMREVSRRLRHLDQQLAEMQAQIDLVR
ncbi:MAG: cyclic nucleotide-binding protein [Oceanospirillaceae bacterium]|nr:cyclic nucleotide-binding protein [Oceanospirillaceae bacterium]